jgi:prepilin-type processing-associated H-X9-DG protein
MDTEELESLGFRRAAFAHGKSHLQKCANKPQGGQGSSSVVTFADYSVVAHSKKTDDMWQADLWKKMGNYCANFLYLDGHVEYHEFTSVAGYFRVLHGPISQTCGSGKIQAMLDAPDVWKQP